jgi:hypothetical protein
VSAGSLEDEFADDEQLKMYVLVSRQISRLGNDLKLKSLVRQWSSKLT